MKVENPSYDITGQVASCHICPLGAIAGGSICHQWWNRDGAPAMPTCPTAATYQAACEFAEAHKEGK